ncbi:MAG: hypothetical protein U9Q99_01095 [Nanoarchaeota archaeon]|nr:hypothetical protein [Nanoarchaeota archaeon]
MIEKDKLLLELKEAFEKTKQELGFRATFEEIDEAFNLKDSILSTEFISPNFTRQLCSRIVENYMGWYNYLNGLLIPSPSYMASQTESKIFSSEEERKNIWNLIKKIMNFSTTHSLLGFSKNKQLEANFIDESLRYWVSIFQPNLIKVLTKVNEGWNSE